MASGQSPKTSGHVTKSPTPPRLAYANEQKNLMTASPVTMKSKRTTKPTIRVLRKKRKTEKKYNKQKKHCRPTNGGRIQILSQACRICTPAKKIKTKTLQQFAFPLFASTADTSSQKNDR